MLTSKSTTPPLPITHPIRPRSAPVRIGRALVDLLTAGATLYGLAALVYLIARFIIGERWHAITIANNLMPMLLIPALPCTLILLVTRRWRATALIAPGAAAFVILYGGMLLPVSLRQSTPIPDDVPTLTILTWNMHRMLNDAELATALALIRGSGADIVALQEFTQPADDYLTPRLGDIYPYNALHPYATSVNGVGLYSRYPIYADEYWVRQLGNMWAQIVVNEQLIMVYNVHPSSPGISVNTRVRTLDVTDILARIEAEELPLLVVGDFNLTDQSDDYGRLAARLRDSFRQAGAGLGLTFPNLGATNPLLGSIPPVIRIDYIWHSDHWVAVEARVNESAGGSDHFPVIARLALIDASGGA